MEEKTASTKTQIFRTITLLIVLGLAVHFLLPYIKSFRQAFTIISHMDLRFVSIALAALVISYLGVGYSMHTLAAIYRQKLSILRGSGIFTASSSVGLVAGGMFGSIFAIARWTHKEGMDLKTASVLAILPSYLNTAFITILSLFSITHLLLVDELSTVELIVFLIILLLLLVVIAVMIWANQHQEAFLLRVHALTLWYRRKFRRPSGEDISVDKLRQSFMALDELRNGKWHLPVIGALIYVIFDNITLYMIFWAAHQPVAFLKVLTGYGLPLLMGKAAFVLPGGLGIVEATMAGIFSSFGVPSSTALAVVLVYRFMSFWSTTILGFALIVYLAHSSGASGSEDQVESAIQKE